MEAEIRVAEGKAKAIQLVNEAAEKYFVGIAMVLKQLEVTENALRDNAKIVVTEKGISPSSIIGELPVGDGSKGQTPGTAASATAKALGKPAATRPAQEAKKG